jgi:hypothetical protein
MRQVKIESEAWSHLLNDAQAEVERLRRRVVELESQLTVRPKPAA